MSGGVTRTEGNGEEDQRANVRCSRLSISLQGRDQSGCSLERQINKESSIAVVLPQKPEEQEEVFITPIDEKVEVIKVYLESRPETARSVKMLTDEVSQIQEVRYCLKTLREQMAARQNNNNNKHPVNGFRVHSPHSRDLSNGNIVVTDSDAKVEDNQEESVRLREATRRLYAQLKEMEKRHQEEREKLQAESQEYSARLAEQSERLQKAEEQSEERGQQVEELQRLLGSMEIESGILKDKMAAGEAELLQLKANREEGAENEKRCEELEKEVAVLKEKIHHLDDMLKSQQRKVRHMIEQLQNSRTVIQERDRFIRDLEERVAFLEAENKEMHDHMEYFLAGQEPPYLTSSENKPEVVYSKPLTPTSPTNKALPFIKVIEIMS
ncbi:tuftelin 1b isoform X1 [Plectropomus leopardus]|uniref:tuftelin 1b isoform X1 n=1 Tax=Plectropomus leopardus TaxID=160734 RepID=UPI001C4B4647|nr:tuftelin 1b isoform X1 [Plectropomus leopardus]